MPGTKKSRYIPALDGLRAFAVLAVIAYHMGLAWAPGGLLGVTVFFVLSGYLITSLLLIEWDDTGKIDLPRFWLRRVRRLFPAIVLVILCTAALCTLLDHSLLTKLRDDMWAALLWVTNWWYIFHDVSYFEALGAPSPLTHFWSLAIEEQFYLVWPVVLFLAHKLGAKRTTMRNATLALALLSAAEMALLFDPAADPSRVYYGTDTRAFSLLIGAWLAFVWPSHLLGAKSSVHLTKNVRAAFDGVGIAAFAGLVAMAVLVDGFSPFWYYGGTLLASVLTAVLIAVMVHPASLLGRAAGAKPLVWVGLRSYGIYLWHYPLLLLMNPRTFTGETPWWLYLVQLAVVFACAAFSYRFVEDPIRKGAIGAFAKRVRAREVDVPAWLGKRAVPVCAGAVVVAVAVGGLVFVPPTSALEGGDLLKDEEAHVAGIPEVPPETPADGEAPAVQPVLDVLMIGDSVSVRAIPYFEEAFPYGAIDAAVNRQIYAGAEVYQPYAEQAIVGGAVVFALGTNGPANDEEIDELMAAVGTDKQVFFVNTRSPQPWVGETNDALARAAERYGNASVIDWHDASAGQDAYFDGDGTHLTEEGAQAYIDLVHEAVAPYLPSHEEDDEAARLKSPAELAVESAQEAAKALIERVPQAI
ncbi:acyltransferase family protein [Arabiibacter massiliensis]|uniref:acyltransferase family protein n=1 Tax=Arabiibacter massiliensis TaxID=1870985 RepID=UPI0009B957B7|nr:acyltransferase family protein [Arabiibacter massiliensis]